MVTGGESTDPDVKVVTGLITSISVSGHDQKSAEIVVVIYVDGSNETYAVYSEPETGPHLFASFASLLTAAYQTKTVVDLYSLPMAGQPTATRRIVQLDCPSKDR